MYKKTNLPVPCLLVIGLFITGCSQQPVNLAAPAAALADIQSATMLKPSAVDAQVQNVVKPSAPKPHYTPRPQKMVKPIQRIAKPVQRRYVPKPVQRQRMLNTSKHRMVKPIQRQTAY